MYEFSGTNTTTSYYRRVEGKTTPYKDFLLRSPIVATTGGDSSGTSSEYAKIPESRYTIKNLDFITLSVIVI